MDKIMLNPVEELLYAVLPKKQIVDIMVTAFEGGCNHWLKVPLEEIEKANAFIMISSNIEEAKELGIQTWGSSGDIFSTSEALTFYTMKSPLTIIENGTDMPLPNLDLSSDKLISVLKQMANDCPVHLQSILGESYDVENVDVFVQYLVFGKLIYG